MGDMYDIIYSTHVRKIKSMILSSHKPLLLPLTPGDKISHRVGARPAARDELFCHGYPMPSDWARRAWQSTVQANSLMRQT